MAIKGVRNRRSTFNAETDSWAGRVARPQRLRSLNGSDFGWHDMTALRKGVASGGETTAFAKDQTVPHGQVLERRIFGRPVSASSASSPLCQRFHPMQA